MCPATQPPRGRAHHLDYHRFLGPSLPAPMCVTSCAGSGGDPTIEAEIGRRRRRQDRPTVLGARPSDPCAARRPRAGATVRASSRSGRPRSERGPTGVAAAQDASRNLSGWPSCSRSAQREWKRHPGRNVPGATGISPMIGGGSVKRCVTPAPRAREQRSRVGCCGLSSSAGRRPFLPRSDQGHDAVRSLVVARRRGRAESGGCVSPSRTQLNEEVENMCAWTTMSSAEVGSSTARGVQPVASAGRSRPVEPDRRRARAGSAWECTDERPTSAEQPADPLAQRRAAWHAMGRRDCSAIRLSTVIRR